MTEPSSSGESYRPGTESQSSRSTDHSVAQRIHSNINASQHGLPSFLQHPYWKSKLPERFEKIVWLHNIDEETKKLWDYDPPRLVPSTFNHNAPMIATQVLQFITGASTDKLNIHQHGQRVTGKSKDKMQGLAFNCYNQALLTPKMFPTQHPQRPTTMIDVNIPVEPTPPESLSSRWNMCKIISSSLVTPTWAYSDFHYGKLISTHLTVY